MLRGGWRWSADERNSSREHPLLCSAQLSRCPDPGRRECRVPPFSYRSAVRWSAPSPPARAPRDGRVHQPVGARRARGRRRRRRGGSLCRRLGHGQLHPRSARLPGGAQVGRHGSGSGGAALPGGRPQPPAAPAAALGPSGGDPAGNALIFARGLSQPGLCRWGGGGAQSLQFPDDGADPTGALEQGALCFLRQTCEGHSPFLHNC